MQAFREEHSRQRKYQSKGPEVEACLSCSRNSKRTGVKGRIITEEIRVEIEGRTI